MYKRGLVCDTTSMHVKCSFVVMKKIISASRRLSALQLQLLNAILQWLDSVYSQFTL